MHMSAVIMGGDEKSMFALQKSGRQLIADLVRFLWRDLSRLEGLAQLIGNHFVANPPAGNGHILIPCKQKLLVYGFRGTGIR